MCFERFKHSNLKIEDQTQCLRNIIHDLFFYRKTFYYFILIQSATTVSLPNVSSFHNFDNSIFRYDIFSWQLTFLSTSWVWCQISSKLVLEIYSRICEYVLPANELALPSLVEKNYFDGSFSSSEAIFHQCLQILSRITRILDPSWITPNFLSYFRIKYVFLPYWANLTHAQLFLETIM